MTNERYRRIRDFNDYFLTFLSNIGFQKVSGGSDPTSNDIKYKFSHEDVADFGGLIASGS